MAEGGHGINISCSICFEEFKVPKMLPCGHTFCCQCVSKMVDRYSSLQCPTCRKDIILPVSGSVEDFPTNYALMSFIPDHEALNETDDAVCECMEHKTPMEFYCKSCEKQICAKCLLNDHKPDEHNIVTASDVVTDLSGELQKLEEKLQQYKEEEKSLGEKIFQGIDHYEQDKEKLEQDIKITLEMQQEKLKKTAETLLNELHNKVEGRTSTYANLKMQYSNLQALSNQIQENCKDLNNCFQQLCLSHSPCEIQKVSKNIETLKGDIESLKTVCRLIPTKVGLNFTAAKNWQLGRLTPGSSKPMILQHENLNIKNGDDEINDEINDETDDEIDGDRLHKEFAQCGKGLSAKNPMQFVDDVFPPAPRSIHGNAPSATQLAGLVASWLRPNELQQHLENPTTAWKVFRHPISPSDISQGGLADNWFLSALTVLAEKPQLLESIMITKETNPEGAYHVRLCNDGLWDLIVIDDSLPANDSGYLIFSKAKRKQLWVPLIEKALAKMNGSYEALVSGECLEGLAILTGAPCESIHLQGNENNNIIVDKDLIWATLLSSREAGYLMGASCGGRNMKTDKAVYESVGLKARHSYSVLDVRDICDNRLLKLRSAWGRFSWNGDWSDDSPKWTEDLREALGAHESREGIFWISMDDMLKYFDSMDICKHHPGTSEFRVQGNFPVSASTPSKVVFLTLDRPTQVDLTLYQTWRKNGTLTSNPLDLMVVVIRTDGGQVVGEPKVVAFTRRQVKAFVSCGAMLEPGEYIILCCSFNTLNGTASTPTLGQPYVLALHSSRPVLHSHVFRDHTLIAESLIALAVQKGKRHQDRRGVAFYSLDGGWSGNVMVAENRYPNYYMHVDSNFTGSSNVVSTRGQLRTVDSIPPLHRQIINILSQCVKSGYSVCHCTKNRMSTRPDLKDWGPSNAQHLPELTPDVYALHCPVPL